MTIKADANSYTNSSLNDALKQLSESAKKSFDEATPIPPIVNHSINFYNLEQTRIFNKEWICIGRCDEIPMSGDFITHEIAGTPILVVRQESGEIKSFVNACAHRFTCLVREKSGHAFAFTCPNHAWTYGIDGQLNHAPFMDLKSKFDSEDVNLEVLRTESWEGFIYVTLSRNPSKKVADSRDFYNCCLQ